MTHICIGKLTIVGSDNGLALTNAGIFLIGASGTNFSEILIETRIFSFKKMGLKASSAKWRPFCLGLNVLMDVIFGHFFFLGGGGGGGGVGVFFCSICNFTLWAASGQLTSFDFENIVYVWQWVCKSDKIISTAFILRWHRNVHIIFIK